MVMFIGHLGDHLIDRGDGGSAAGPGPPVAQPLHPRPLAPTVLVVFVPS